MTRIGHMACWTALAALLAVACGGTTMQSDAGAGAHDAAASDAGGTDSGSADAATDALVDAGPRVPDVCTYWGKYPPTVPDPRLQTHPYAYYCDEEVNDPACIETGFSDSAQAWEYACSEPPPS